MSEFGGIPGLPTTGWCVASGTANAIVLTPVPASPPMLAYFAGLRLRFLAVATNTGAATVGLAGSALQPAALNRPDGTALAAGDVAAGGLYTIVFDGGGFRVLDVGTVSPPPPPGPVMYAWGGVAGGTANALTFATTTPSISGYGTGGLQVAFISSAAANTGPATAQVAALPAVAIEHANGTALGAGSIPANSLLEMVFDGSGFRLTDVCCVSPPPPPPPPPPPSPPPSPPPPVPPPGLNYWGDGSDGVGHITTSQTLPSTLDGDMVVKNYLTLTIDAGATLTTASRCRGLLVYVDGDCTINGALTMTARGPSADPTSTGSGDGHPVNAAGITFWRRAASGSAAFVANGTFGCGTAAVASEANQLNSAGNATLFTIARAGAAGAPQQNTGTSGPPYGFPGFPGVNGTVGQSGGGGSGGGSGITGGVGIGGAGGAGTCFSGGAGGGAGCAGAGSTGSSNGVAGAANGGAGGAAGPLIGASRASTGGSGNPAGANNVTGGTVSAGGTGTGGLLVLLVRGNLTLGAAGVINANGVAAASPTGASIDNVAGGSSGGGNILILCGGSLPTAGTIQAMGGASAPANGGGGVNAAGGGGGNGSVQGPTQIDV